MFVFSGSIVKAMGDAGTGRSLASHSFALPLSRRTILRQPAIKYVAASSQALSRTQAPALQSAGKGPSKKCPSLLTLASGRGIKAASCLFRETRNAVRFRSGPATVTGDSRSRVCASTQGVATPTGHCLQGEGEKALQDMRSGSQETIPETNTLRGKKDGRRASFPPFRENADRRIDPAAGRFPCAEISFACSSSPPALAACPPGPNRPLS
jgi:hypothetical protein